MRQPVFSGHASSIRSHPIGPSDVSRPPRSREEPLPRAAGTCSWCTKHAARRLPLRSPARNGWSPPLLGRAQGSVLRSGQRQALGGARRGSPGGVRGLRRDDSRGQLRRWSGDRVGPGSWTPVGDPNEGLAKGKLLFRLDGHKLHGMWTLVKLKKGEKEWLLIKERDAYVTPGGREVPEGSVAFRRHRRRHEGEGLIWRRPCSRLSSG